MQIKLLVGITKARNIPEFDKAVEKVLSKYDKIIYYYFPAWKVRHLLRDFFLSHAKYTHLAILPDDLIINDNALNYLLEDLDNDCSYPAICGCCNVNQTDLADKLNISLFRVNPKFTNGTYYYNFIDIQNSQLDANVTRPLTIPYKLIRIHYAGDPFPILHRRLVRKLSFNNNAAYNDVPVDQGCCEDVVMCHEMYELGVPYYTDLRARMLHLKQNDNQSRKELLVGIKKEEIKFIPSTA